MEQAGYADGFEFTVKVPANYQAHIDTAQIIAQQLPADQYYHEHRDH